MHQLVLPIYFELIRGPHQVQVQNKQCWDFYFLCSWHLLFCVTPSAGDQSNSPLCSGLYLHKWELGLWLIWGLLFFFLPGVLFLAGGHGRLLWPPAVSPKGGFRRRSTGSQLGGIRSAPFGQPFASTGSQKSNKIMLPHYGYSALAFL